jgi:hypothetical protein
MNFFLPFYINKKTTFQPFPDPCPNHGLHGQTAAAHGALDGGRPDFAIAGQSEQQRPGRPYGRVGWGWGNPKMCFINPYFPFSGIYKMVFECEKFGINKDQCESNFPEA